jgi:hypothetical protein
MHIAVDIDLKCGIFRLIPFHVQRRMVPRLKNGFALNEKTMGGSNHNIFFNRGSENINPAYILPTQPRSREEKRTYVMK